MLRQYREWAKSTQIRQAKAFTGAQVFWGSIKRLLNEVFPGKRYKRETISGGRGFCVFGGGSPP